MYYFYLIESVNGRPGFGITSIPHERNKQYVSHAGDLVKFVYLFGGQKTHAKALEAALKTQFVDNLWKLDDWETEWLADGFTMEFLYNHVVSLIEERHYRLSVVATNFDYKSKAIDNIDV